MSFFNQNIAGWNVASVTSLNQAFSGATSFNVNIGGWNTARVAVMSDAFSVETGRPVSAFNQDLSGWNTASVRRPRPASLDVQTRA